jgi:tagaturonate reductase
MQLSRYTLKNISSRKVIVPNEEVFELPEKVLQFGTGKLLRGLPDYFIDKANRKGIFNGRIVIIKSTSKGDATAFEKQNGLYTLCVRGIVEGEKIEQNIISSSVSRVLIAQTDWAEILACAHNQNLKVIISNTTEVGIQLVNEDIHGRPPVSFPGKLLAFLYERFIAFDGSYDSGLVIVPTELISDNGKKLESVVMQLADLNFLEDEFIEWLKKCNFFCNSLVDRIVTGTPDDKIKNEIENELGYKDDLMIVSEVYSLWAIEGDEKVRSILSFVEADEGVEVKPNINLYRELKLRLLNGTHTLSCGVALLAGFDTVLDAMEDPIFFRFIKNLMVEELAPCIPYEIDEELKQDFISKVIDRFRNPYINHLWRDITLNYSSKMLLRCIPLLVNYYRNHDTAPKMFALGFASYAYFMKVKNRNGNEFYSELMGKSYVVEDEMAGRFHKLRSCILIECIVENVLKEESFWRYNLSILPGFQESIIENLNNIITEGIQIK